MYRNGKYKIKSILLAFAVSFSDRALQLRSLSGLVCDEQDLLKTKCIKEKCNLQYGEMYTWAIVR